jgi:4-methylaminobutanoate oxidase (formaldehyde-forming)
MAVLPDHAQAVIIGGGIVGCSTAYHLAGLGWSDVVVLERARLTSGSTFHAAGLVGQLRSNANVTRLLQYSVALYATLEQETGQATGWKMNGGLRLACNEARMIELERLATTARSFGLEMQLLSPHEAKSLWPLMTISDLVGAVFLPTDGQANPSDLTQALAKGARQRGARIIEECSVDAIVVDSGRVRAVRTTYGEIRCDVVVNCAGQWAREVGALAGVCVPVTSVQHQYLITEPFDVPRTLPTLRDPDRRTYFKEEVGGLLMGGYEANPIPWAIAGIPPGFHFTLLESNWDHFEPLMAAALARVPMLETAGVRTLINGPEAFTPDGNFILGEAPELRGFYVGAGFNAFGIASGGGAGKALAEWIVGGEPPMDLWPVDIRRFGEPHADVDWVRRRTLELYGKHYTIAWPHEEHESGRPRRTSPLYQRLGAARACFGSKMGWERPNWFAPPGVEPRDTCTFGRANWFDHVAREHHATRNGVALFDESSFAKLMLVGGDAESALSWICANDVAKPPGAVVYTQMLNRRGGIECDLTVSRLASDTYYIVTGTAFGTHDATWIARNVPAGMDARLLDVTDEYAVLGLMGPRAREVLAAVTSDDVDDESFPFATCRRIHIAGVAVWALRITYVGELGWELHIAAEQAGVVYDELMQAGELRGIVNAGYRAIESLRLEKGYRAWGADIGPDHTPLEAGLGWAVKLSSGVPFQGREALIEQKRAGVSKRLACFTAAAEVVLLGRETIYRDGIACGWLTSGGYGYTTGKAIGYGYVRNPPGIDTAYLKAGHYELEVATKRVACELQLGPPYDPAGRRVRA